MDSRSIVCLALLLGCATVIRPADFIVVEVTNLNWWTTTVYVECVGGSRAVLHDFAKGEIRHQRVNRRGCTTYRILVYGLGGRSNMSDLVYVESGHRICVRIDPGPRMTTWATNCTEYADAG